MKKKKRQAAQTPHQRAKNVRKVGTRTFTKIESSFEENFKNCQNLQDKISELEQIVKDRKIIVSDGNGSPVEQPLKPIQVIGYKKKLNEAKLELKRATRKLKMHSQRYSRACKINMVSAKDKVKKLNMNQRLARTAQKKYDEILKAVKGQIDLIKRSNKEIYHTLENLALTNGREFNANLYRLMRRELKDCEIIKMMAVAPAVRTKVFQEVRRSFGWGQ